MLNDECVLQLLTVYNQYCHKELPSGQGIVIMAEYSHSEFDHCITLNSKNMFAYMQIIISAAAAAVLYPFTYHTECSSPRRSAGFTDWRRPPA